LKAHSLSDAVSGGGGATADVLHRSRRTILTAPRGAYTHNIALSPGREKETEQSLKMMFDLGYVKPEEVPQTTWWRAART